MEYLMYVFKESGKWYATENVTFKNKCVFQILEEIENGETKIGYMDMDKTFIPADLAGEGIPFQLKGKR